jgi:hypothetical protein
MQYQRDKDARQVPTATPKARNLSYWMPGTTPAYCAVARDVNELGNFQIKSMIKSRT